jgi:pyruvate carboxylase
MAGLLTPRAATMLVSALREEFPNTPIHVHTHDTAGSGVASMLAAAVAGADIVDVAIDAMSGMTSQPSLGAIAANLKGTDLDTGIDLAQVGPLNTYWENVRSLYAPFESGQLSGSSDVLLHEIPGGQYTNLLFQSKQLGLTEKWPEIKRKYAQANVILGDIPKVTPSSKVVGDLAQFMVAQNLQPHDIVEQADTLALPQSVVDYLRGDIGIPPGGFPEPLRSKVLKSRGLHPVDGRPGKYLKAYNFELGQESLEKTYGANRITEKDLLSFALYQKVFEEWKEYEKVYGDVDILPTHAFLHPMTVGKEIEVELSPGRSRVIKLVAIQDVDEETGFRTVLFEVNGEQYYMTVTDQSMASSGAGREKAGAPGTVGSPMPGVVVVVKVKAGDRIKEGDTVATLSAMKMETSVPATSSGVVKRVVVNVGDKVERDDLLVEIQ